MASELTPSGFVAKWSRVTLSERAASQQHFLDLCGMLSQPTPAGHDATGAEYTFEKGVAVSGPASRGARGERGFADVWWWGKFAWEYKRKGKYRDLHEAYRQLCQYREGTPKTRPVVSVDTSQRLQHTIAFVDEATPTRKAKPAGVMGPEIWVNVGEPQSGPAMPPTGPSELSFLSVDKRTPYVVNYRDEDGGKTAHYMLRWVATTGEKGPWTETASATIGA